MANELLKETAAEDLLFLKRLWNDGRVMKTVGFPNGLGETDESMARRLYTRCGLKEEPRPLDMPNQDWPFWALHRKDWEARFSSSVTDAT